MKPGFYILTAGGFPSPRKIRNHSLKSKPQLIFIAFGSTKNKYILNSFRHLLKRRGFAYPNTSAESFYHTVIINIHSLTALTPGSNCTVLQRDTFVRHDKLRIEFKYRSKSVTTFACAIRAVKTKQPGRKLLQRCLGMLRAREFFAVNSLPPTTIATIFLTVDRLLY